PVACCHTATVFQDFPHAAATRSCPLLFWCRRAAGPFAGPRQLVRAHAVRAMGASRWTVGGAGIVHRCAGPHVGGVGRPGGRLCRLANSLSGSEAGGGGLPALPRLGCLASGHGLAWRTKATTPVTGPALPPRRHHEPHQP